MMIRTLAIALSILLCSNIHSQSTIDSLKSQAIKSKDSIKVETLLSISDYYFKHFDPDSLLKYSNQALTEVSAINNKRQIASALIYKGIIYSLTYEFDTSFVYYNKAEVIATAINAQDLLASINLKKGFNYDRLDDHEKSLHYFLAALNYYQTTDDYTNLAKSYMNVVSIFGQLEQKEKVVEYIEKSLDLLDKVTDDDICAYLLYASSSQYTALGERESKYLNDARKLALNGLKVAKKAESQTRVVQFYIVLSTVHMLQNEYEKCIAYGDSIIQEGELSASIKIQTEMRLSDGYFGLKKYNEAFKHLDNASVLSNQIQSEYFIMSVAQSAYEKYKTIGEFEKSLQAFEKWQSMEDSISNIEQKNTINELETKYETEKKNLEIASLTAETSLKEVKIQHQQLTIAIAVILFLVVITILILFYRQRSLKKQNELLSLEQRFLRSQMNPHFIFNALGAIQKFIVKNDPIPSATFIAKFSSLMRKVLEHSREEFVKLSEELESLINYLDLQQLRFENKFDYTIEIEEGLDHDEILIPPMFAQPFIENALEHGLSAVDKGEITIKINKIGNRLMLKILDNGKGINENTTSANHRSLATKITEERIQRLNAIGLQANFKVENRSNEHGEIIGAEVSLLLPVTN